MLPASAVGPALRDEMFRLFDRYYAGATRDTFESDLDGKDWVVLVRDGEAGTVVGFTTGRLVQAGIGGQAVSAIYSGDTIVDQSQWGRSTLAGTWGRLILSLLDEHQGRELGWFLICQGYRTYRFLPVFFREFFPRHDRPTTPLAASRIATFGRTLFGARFDERSGIVRADEHSYVVRPGVSDVDPARLASPHVRFFVERNPGHERGDQLCCWAPLHRDDLLPSAWRVMGSGPPG
ncbi:MAG: hypothetical protein ACYTG2_12040 [Planctomycetota bacterium]